MAASNQLINIAWAPQWKRLKNNAPRDAKWFNNANETRGETKAAPQQAPYTWNPDALPPPSATPRFSVVSLVFIVSWQLLLLLLRLDINAPAFHFHVTSMQIKVLLAATLRIRNVSLCHPKNKKRKLHKATHNLHNNRQADLPSPIPTPLPCTTTPPPPSLCPIQQLAKCDNKLLSTFIYLWLGQCLRVACRETLLDTLGF